MIYIVRHGQTDWNVQKKVMEKCSFIYEGKLKKYLKLCDGYHDMLLYSIVADE